MAERSEAIEEQAVRDGSAAYLVEPEVATAEDVPSGYKQTEVGVIPEDWELMPLREVAEVRTGIAKNTKLVVTDPIAVHYLRVANVQDGFLDLSEMKRVTISKTDLNRYRVLPGDVLMNEGGDLDKLGRGAIWKGALDPCVHQNHVFVVRCKKSLEPEFLAAWSSADVGRSYFLVAGKQTTNLASINKTALGGLPIAVPAKAEQRAIATALSDADALIESLDRLIAKKRAIKQAAMQQLLTGQTRLPGFTGEWETKRLGEHVTFLKTGTNSRSELSEGGCVAYLHYGDIHVGASVTLNPNTATVPRIEASKVRHLDKLMPGDLVFVDASEDLEGVGKSVEIAAVPEGGMVAGLHTISARFDKTVLADGFKAYLQFCPAFIGTLRRLAAGTKVLATNRQHIARVDMKLPNVSEQKAIATVLSDMDTEIEALEHRRDKARQIKQGMMQELLTGRTRLV